MPRISHKKSRVVVDDQSDADAVFEDTEASQATQGSARAARKRTGHTLEKGASKKRRAGRGGARDTVDTDDDGSDEEDAVDDQGGDEEAEGSDAPRSDAEEEEEEEEEEEAPKTDAGAKKQRKKRTLVPNGDDDGSYKGPAQFRRASATCFRKWHAANQLFEKIKVRVLNAETRLTKARDAATNSRLKLDEAFAHRRTPAQLAAAAAAAAPAPAAQLLPAPVVNAMIEAAVQRKEHADVSSCVYMPCCFKVIAAAAAATAAACPLCSFRPVATQCYMAPR